MTRRSDAAINSIVSRQGPACSTRTRDASLAPLRRHHLHEEVRSNGSVGHRALQLNGGRRGATASADRLLTATRGPLSPLPDRPFWDDGGRGPFPSTAGPLRVLSHGLLGPRPQFTVLRGPSSSQLRQSDHRSLRRGRRHEGLGDIASGHGPRAPVGAIDVGTSARRPRRRVGNCSWGYGANRRVRVRCAPVGFGAGSGFDKRGVEVRARSAGCTATRTSGTVLRQAVRSGCCANARGPGSHRRRIPTRPHRA
jgi:hypothetical protein